jgi:hypothetical protein
MFNAMRFHHGFDSTLILIQAGFGLSPQLRNHTTEARRESMMSQCEAQT